MRKEADPGPPEDRSLEEKFTHPGRGSYLACHAAAFFALLANLVVYRICVQALGDEAFAEYAVGKRTLSYALTLMGTGLGVAISHHVAASGENSRDYDGNYLLGGTTLMLLFLSPIFLLAALLPDQLAYVFFGDASRGSLILPLAFALAGTSCINVCNSYLFGKMEFVKAACLTVVGAGLLPLAVVLIVDSSAASIFLWQGVGAVLVSLVTYAVFLRPVTGHFRKGGREWIRHTKHLLSFGLPRVPGAFAVAAILSLPVTLLTHSSDDLAVAGVLALGGTLFTLIGAATDPISRILLPQVSALSAGGRQNELKPTLFKFALGLSLILVPVLVGVGLFIRPLISTFLTPQLATRADIILWLLPACLPYAYYRCFRGVVDGAFKRASNTWYSLASLAVFGLWVLLAQALGWPEPPLQAHLVSLLLLGGLTLWKVGRLVKHRPE